MFINQWGTFQLSVQQWARGEQGAGKHLPSNREVQYPSGLGHKPKDLLGESLADRGVAILERKKKGILPFF